MRVTANDFTHIGQGEENQDRVRVLTSQDGDASLLVVADGLGGHSGAALGAETVVETADRLWGERAGSSDDEEFLRKLALESHAAVNKTGHEHGKDPRSTLAALLLNGSEAVSVHAGDSRVMQLSGDRMVKRTLDHSIGQLSVLRGAITEEQLATHPDQKKLFAHIGGEAEPDFEINRWNLNEGGRFVVCSDGFWEVFPVDEIHTLFEAADPIRELGTRLEEKLARMEGHDNTSAILAEVHPLPRATWYWVALGNACSDRPCSGSLAEQRNRRAAALTRNSGRIGGESPHAGRYRGLRHGYAVRASGPSHHTGRGSAIGRTRAGRKG